MSSGGPGVGGKGSYTSSLSAALRKVLFVVGVVAVVGLCVLSVLQLPNVR